MRCVSVNSFKFPTNNITIIMITCAGLTFDKDVALVQIPAIDFTAQPSIRPICLPTPSVSYDNTNLTVAGWGRVSGELVIVIEGCHTQANL